MKHTTGAPQEQPGLTLSLSSVPLAMREARRWLLHDEKKIPYYASGRPRSGKLNSPRDLAQLVDFEAACAALLAFEGRFAGLGFALGEGWQGCDLDDVRDPKSGALLSWAADLIEKAGTYSEVSVSGRGVHLMGYGVALATLGANGSGIEFYADKRYFIVTGKPLNAVTRIVDLAPVYDIMTGRHLGKPVTQATKQKPVAPPGGASLEWPDFARQLNEKLKHVPCVLKDYDRWRDIGMIIKYECGGNEEGFRLFHAWSRDTAKGYKDEADCRKYWDSFKVDHPNPLRWGTLQKLYFDVYVPKLEAKPTGDLLPFADITVDPVIRAPIIEGWLYERVVVLQAADGGAGKSYLGLLEAMMVAGGNTCGMGWTVEPGRVLFYSGEDDADIIRLRMRRYCSHYGWSMEDFRNTLAIVDRSELDCVLYTEDRGFTEEYARLARTVTQWDPRYVVIDNASHVFNGNENNRSAVRHFLSGLTALRRAVNLLAHVNKVTAGASSGANQAVAYSGSTAWNNTVRARRAQSFEEGRGTITIAKSNYGPTGTTLHYEWDDLAKLFTPRSVVGREHARDHTERLLAVVRQLEGTLASLEPRAANHLAKLIQAHPDCPKGIDLKGLKRWTEQMLVQRRIEEAAVQKANRRWGKTYRVLNRS